MSCSGAHVCQQARLPLTFWEPDTERLMEPRLKEPLAGFPPVPMLSMFKSKSLGFPHISVSAQGRLSVCRPVVGRNSYYKWHNVQFEPLYCTASCRKVWRSSAVGEDRSFPLASPRITDNWQDMVTSRGYKSLNDTLDTYTLLLCLSSHNRA